MKRIASFLSIVLVASALAAPVHAAESAGWTDDFAAAKAEAAASGKDLLLDFTGSDWCVPCVMLDREVFGTDAFQASAPDDFVLVKLDYPRGKIQPDEVKLQNAVLGDRYNPQGQYPLILLVDAQGMPYAETGYLPGGAMPYLSHLNELRERRTTRDAALAEADSAEGMDKARALDRAMEAVGFNLAVTHYRQAVDQIMALDADDAAGLRSKYALALLDADMQVAVVTFRKGDAEGGLQLLDQMISEHDPQGRELQMIRATEGQVKLKMGRAEEAIGAFELALAADPESRLIPQIEKLLGLARSQVETPAAE